MHPFWSFLRRPHPVSSIVTDHQRGQPLFEDYCQPRPAPMPQPVSMQEMIRVIKRKRRCRPNANDQALQSVVLYSAKQRDEKLNQAGKKVY